MISGDYTVTTTLSAVGTSSDGVTGGFFLKADPGNSATVYVGGASDPAALFPLKPGDTLNFQTWPSPPTSLADIVASGPGGGEKLCWLRQP